jgi:hypothetical protein
MIYSRSIIKLSFLIFAVLSFSLKAAMPDSDLVGSTQGSFSVGPGGSASYDIPIKLPPNVGGVQPNLSLSYNSSGGNGLLGMGWQLSGLSAISRCPTTLERDKFIDVVDFDDNDKFCLDGQRLVVTGYQTYRTELDDFALIVGNESGFTVTTSAGLKMHYGDSSNSQILAQGRSDVLTWSLREVSDNFGNNYSIEYKNNGYIEGEYWPTIIKMGNHTSTLSHVSFLYDYDDRLDVVSGYIGGTKYQTSKRLKSVNIFSGNNKKIRSHEITYKNYQEPLNISYVEEIKECDAQNDC